MAAGNFNLGKASGGILNVSPADGTTNTSLVLPASGTVVATDVAVTDNAIARYDGTTGKVQNSGVIIDDNGNIGIGVTPSAWYSGWRALELGFGGNAIWSPGANDIRFSANTYNDGVDKYKSTGLSSRYLQASGSHIWSIAQSGTAGNTITWTNAMTLDASGNLGVGGTPNNSRVYIEQLNASNNALTVFHNSSLQTQKIVSISNGINGGTEVLKVDGSGNLLLTSSTGGLGYGTGSGGTVTQLTSKGANVTLNKPTGKIIMNNSALASTAKVEFVLSSNLITAGDLVCVNIAGGVLDARSYRIESINTAIGGVYIRLTNLSGGSLSEAVEVAFAIIKGATA